MWQLLDVVCEPVFRIFGLVWTEDDRPAARWFSVGCLAIVLLGIGIVFLAYSGK